MSTGAQPGRLRRPGRGPGLKNFKPQPIHLTQAAACSNQRSRLFKPADRGVGPARREHLTGLASHLKERVASVAAANPYRSLARFSHRSNTHRRLSQVLGRRPRGEVDLALGRASSLDRKRRLHPRSPSMQGTCPDIGGFLRCRGQLTTSDNFPGARETCPVKGENGAAIHPPTRNGHGATQGRGP